MDNTCIIVNTMSDDLLDKSKQFYEHLNICKIYVEGKHGLYGLDFLEKIINDKSISFDWVILLDEDFFLTDTDELFSLLSYMKDNEYHVCGMPDGGVVNIRHHNPVAINPFFCIININKVRNIYSAKEVKKAIFDDDLMTYLPKHLIKTPYDIDGFEKYYKLFFFLLRNNINFLYLDAESANKVDKKLDATSTAIKSHDGAVIGFHSWYARQWREHEQRINNLITYCENNKKVESQELLLENNKSIYKNYPRPSLLGIFLDLIK